MTSAVSTLGVWATWPTDETPAAAIRSCTRADPVRTRWCANHLDVVRVGALDDLQVLLHNPARVGQERPLHANAGPILVGLQRIAGGDSDQTAVTHPGLQGLR